jgi:hypothetical protein
MSLNCIKVLLVLLGNLRAFLLEGLVCGLRRVHVELFYQVLLHGERVPNGRKLLGCDICHFNTPLQNDTAPAQSTRNGIIVTQKRHIKQGI